MSGAEVDGDDLISVITPLLDRAERVHDAIDSVLDQGVAVEHLVVDDGSTDGGAESVEARAAGEPRLRLLRTGPRSGPSAARNVGVHAARGRMVAFVDSDDVVLPGALATLLAHRAASGGRSAFGTERIEVAPGVEAPLAVRRLPPADEVPRWRFLTALLDRQAVLDVGGFDEGLRMGEDSDLFARLVAHGVAFDRLPEELVVRRFFGDNLVYDDDAVRRSVLLAVRRHRTAAQP
jgi:glycosyltransferase involved in cell wall biosynthesis